MLNKIKLIHAILFCLLTHVTLQAQNEEKRYEAERVMRQNNHIDQVLTYHYNLPAKDSFLVERNFYDRLGNLIRRESYDDRGARQYTGILTYNDKGLKTLETGYDGLGKLMQQFVYGYDEAGHQIDYQQVSPTKQVLVHQKSVFNSVGQRIKLYNQSSNHSGFYLSATFAYDSAGRSLSDTMYSEDGETGGSSEYGYDSKGNLTAVYQVVDQQKDLQYTNRYNDENQLVETRFYQRTTHITDGRPTSIRSDRRVEYRYDPEGNLVEESTWNKAILLDRTRYYVVKKGSNGSQKK